MSKRGYKVTETAPGHLMITCDTSGLPYTGANNLGVYCAAEPCQCQVLSKKFMDNLPPELARILGK